LSNFGSWERGEKAIVHPELGYKIRGKVALRKRVKRAHNMSGKEFKKKLFSLNSQ
jgi:hypothetical protein